MVLATSALLLTSCGDPPMEAGPTDAGRGEPSYSIVGTVSDGPVWRSEGPEGVPLWAATFTVSNTGNAAGKPICRMRVDANQGTLVGRFFGRWPVLGPGESAGFRRRARLNKPWAGGAFDGDIECSPSS